MKTVENLKAAITGESNASAKYAKFAEVATKEGLLNIASLFRATSKAESIHAANHAKVLKGLGFEFTPVIEEVKVGTTLENLVKAKDGEDYEVDTMYPGFIETSTAEAVEKATKSFNAAMLAEVKHSEFYAEAIKVLTESKNDATVEGSWLICLVCGDTYKASDPEEKCNICGVPREKFMKFDA